MEELQELAFEIIAVVGEAKQLYMQAVTHAKNVDPEAARADIAAGNQVMTQAHEKHLRCIQREADGEALPFSLLFMHAEDQLLSAELIRDMALQLIAVYETIQKK